MDLINNSNKVDTTKVVENAKKLLVRHVNVSDEWDKLALS